MIFINKKTSEWTFLVWKFYFADLPSLTAISARRFAYAHSLSYQARILMKSSETTRVKLRSTIAEAVVPTISDETN